MGHAILEIYGRIVSEMEKADIGTRTLTSIFKNWIGLETAELRLLTFHVYLKLGFTTRHPVTLDDGRLLGIPAAAAGLLTDRGGIPKGISS